MTDSLDATVAPMTDTVSSAAAPVADSADATVAPITDTAGSALAGAAEPVEAVTAPITDTVSSAAAPVTDSIDATVAPLADAAGSTLADVAEPVETLTAPITDAVGSAAAPLTDSIDATVAPLTDTASSAIAAGAPALGSVTDTFDATLAPATDSLGSVVEPESALSALLAPVNHTVDSAVSSFVAVAEETVAPVADVVSGPSAPLGDTVENTTRPVPGTVVEQGGTDAAPTGAAGSASGGGDGTAGGGPSGGDGLLTVPPSDLTAPAVPGFTGLEGGDLPGGFPSGAATGQPGSALSDAPLASPASGGEEVVQPPFAAPPAGDGSAVAAAPAAGDSSALEVIAATATDPSVLAAATGVAVLVGAGLAGSRLGCAAEARLLFTNVRLLPCLAKNSVSDHLAPLASALPGSGPAGPAAVLRPAVAAEGAVAGTSAVNDPVERSDARTGLLGSFRDGFEQAIRGETREIGESLGDSRLMIQLGMALGFVYTAFLSVWFWATRLRRRPGN